MDINLATPGAICNQENIRLDGSSEVNKASCNSANCNPGNCQSNCNQAGQQAPGSVMKAVNAINATISEVESNNTRNVMINKYANTLSVNGPEKNQCSSSSSSETETNLMNNFNNTVSSIGANKAVLATKKPLLYVLTFTLIAGPVRRFKRICDHIQVQISGRTRPTASAHTKANSTSNSTQSSNSNLSTTSKSGESNLSLLNNHNSLNNRERELKEKELAKNPAGQPNNQPGNQQIILNNDPTNLNAINSFASTNSTTPTGNPTGNNNNQPGLQTAKSPKQMHSKNRDLSDSSCGSCLSDTNHSSLNNNQSSDENMTVNLVANSIRTTTNSSATTSNLISNKLSGKGLALARCKSENPQQALLFSSAVSPFDKDSAAKLSNQSGISSGISSASQQSTGALNGNKQTAAGLRLLSNRKLSLDHKLTTD